MTEKPLETLGEVEQALREWRRTRPSRKIPVQIARRAAALHGRYRTNELLRELKINHRTLMRWKTEFGEPVLSMSPEMLEAPATSRVISKANRSVTQKPRFVTLPARSLEAPPPEAEVALKLSGQRDDGTELTLEGTLTLDQWRSALTLLSTPALKG